jgi:hypothetical protein
MVASCKVTSCMVASCKVASCKVESCMGIKIQYPFYMYSLVLPYVACLD